MAKKKIKETPDFVRGLLKAADLVSSELDGEYHPRDKLNELYDVSDLEREEIRELGMYQGRVVLVALAAELALKWLWECENKVAAKSKHPLLDWYCCLTPDAKKAIESDYKSRVVNAKSDWETAHSVFKKCNKAFEHWRYIVEEGSFPNFAMQATYLGQATISVLRVGEMGTLTE